MVELKEKDRAIIEFTCIPDVSIEKAQQLYDIGFTHLYEFLNFTLDKDAKAKGLAEVLDYRILSQFLKIKDEDIPTQDFKCSLCKGTIYADEEECSDCGALLLEEILGVEMEDVHTGLLETIDTVIATPDAAKKYLEGLRSGELMDESEDMEIVSKEIGKQLLTERGFVALPIIPSEEGKNHLIVISPLGEHEKNRQKAFADFKKFGTGEAFSYSIIGGNIANKQEKAIKSVVSRFINGPDFEGQHIGSLLILNLKFARFLETKATMIVEDNRHFLSSLDDITPDDPRIEDIGNMLSNAELIKKMRKMGGKVLLDEVSFNNDPVSFLMARECIPILKDNPDFNIHIVDVVVNANYVDCGNHQKLVRLLQGSEN